MCGSVTIYRLTNQVQHYDWGSHADIAHLLGRTETGQPEAELWLGAHSSAPSLAQPWGHPDAATIPLNALIQQQPEQMLGTRVLDEYGPKLPYLLKVLAATKALSLQVHPPAHKARAGFNKENRERVPLDAPFRNFKDDNHKPEMIVAVTEFHALAGLRAPRVVMRMLEGLPGRLFDIVRETITAQPNHNGLRTAITKLLNMRFDPDLDTDLADAINAIGARIQRGSQYEVADQTAVDLAEQYPGDVGALSSYLLNRVTLLPGEALFMDDGEAHAYLRGLGVEIMANSDNVLRAGLTSKHVDVPELLECMSFYPKMPFRPDQIEMGSASLAVNYRPPAAEFALSTFDLHGEPLPIHHSGPRIVLVLEGSVSLMSPSGSYPMERGESVFIPDAAGPFFITGKGQATQAWVP